MEYKNHIVAFIDIFGFKNLIKETTSNKRIRNEIYSALELIKSKEDPDFWNDSLVAIEECAQRHNANYYIAPFVNINCFSDSIIISVNLTELEINAALSTLISRLLLLSKNLIVKGVLIRGAITLGAMIHQSGIAMGPALIDAYQLETNIAKFPRIILSDNLIKSLKYPISTKQDQYPYHIYLDRFSDGCVGFSVLKYFQIYDNAPTIHSSKTFKQELKKTKNIILHGLDASFEHPDIYSKYDWLRQEYNNLIILTEEKTPIYNLNEGIRGGNIHYQYTEKFYDRHSVKNK